MRATITYTSAEHAAQAYIHLKDREMKNYELYFKPYNDYSLYVKGLKQGVSPQQLWKRFSAFGKVVEAKLTSKNGSNHGKIVFSTEETAQRLLKEDITMLSDLFIDRPKLMRYTTYEERIRLKDLERRSVMMKNWQTLKTTSNIGMVDHRPINIQYF